MKPPKDLKLDEQLFQVRFTKEIFREYQYPPPAPPSFPPLDCRFFLFFFFFFCCSGFFFVFYSCKLWTFVLVVAKECITKRIFSSRWISLLLAIVKTHAAGMCAISGVQLSIQRWSCCCCCKEGGVFWVLLNVRGSGCDFFVSLTFCVCVCFRAYQRVFELHEVVPAQGMDM